MSGKVKSCLCQCTYVTLLQVNRKEVYMYRIVCINSFPDNLCLHWCVCVIQKPAVLLLLGRLGGCQGRPRAKRAPGRGEVVFCLK